uniref:Probable pectate lyase F n=1 Tax=Ditylenchus dipsaci TaxID=166011 RepID=A0A915E6Z8_9BILA
MSLIIILIPDWNHDAPYFSVSGFSIASSSAQFAAFPTAKSCTSIKATIIVAKGKSYDGKNACLVATTALEEGGSVSNVVFGANAADGGGVKDASDKVLQHNGGGSLTIQDFQADNIGKLYRSCGNCKTQYKRSVTLNNVKLTNVKVAVVGINSNYGDTATIKGLTLVGKKVPIVRSTRELITTHKSQKH